MTYNKITKEEKQLIIEKTYGIARDSICELFNVEKDGACFYNILKKSLELNAFAYLALIDLTDSINIYQLIAQYNLHPNANNSIVQTVKHTLRTSIKMAKLQVTYRTTV